MNHSRTTIAATCAAVLLAISACAPGVPTTPTAGFAGTLSTRSVTVSVAGGGSVTAAPALPGASGGGIAIGYNSSSAVISASGSVGFDGPGAVPGQLTLALSATPLGMSGTVSVLLGGVTNSANGTLASFAADDHGNVSGQISAGGTTISFATSSVALAAGTDPALESLLAQESDFCADAQQRLAGLSEAEVPLASIGNTREATRSAFAASKSTLSPLTTRTWTDTVDIDRGGEHRTISQHISCKTRAADHVATTGVSTNPIDDECSVLNQRSIDLALAQMTPAEIAAAGIPTLGADVVRQTGVDWTTPLAASIEFNGSTLRAHALLTRWNDPAFALFPDTIRGVHYCTVWSPAFAYSALTTPGVAP